MRQPGMSQSASRPWDEYAARVAASSAVENRAYPPNSAAPVVGKPIRALVWSMTSCKKQQKKMMMIIAVIAATCTCSSAWSRGRRMVRNNARLSRPSPQKPTTFQASNARFIGLRAVTGSLPRPMRLVCRLDMNVLLALLFIQLPMDMVWLRRRSKRPSGRRKAFRHFGIAPSVLPRAQISLWPNHHLACVALEPASF